tara:strand:- start:224 stop:418 length:195 start_codon:yes stop_codon:yes gene_type:complete
MDIHTFLENAETSRERLALARSRAADKLQTATATTHQGTADRLKRRKKKANTAADRVGLGRVEE